MAALLKTVHYTHTGRFYTFMKNVISSHDYESHIIKLNAKYRSEF